MNDKSREEFEAWYTKEGYQVYYKGNMAAAYEEAWQHQQRKIEALTGPYLRLIVAMKRDEGRTLAEATILAEKHVAELLGSAG